jgi:hypothetical protein
MYLPLLVGVTSGAGPDLELHSIDQGSVRNVKTFVVERLDLADERVDRYGPAGIASAEKRGTTIQTFGEGDFRAVRVGGRSDTKRADCDRHWVKGLRARNGAESTTGALTDSADQIKKSVES